MSEREIGTAERIARLEVTSASHTVDIKSHGEHLRSLDKAVTTLITEVRGIRKALYVLAAAVASNIPLLKELLTWLK